MRIRIQKFGQITMVYVDDIMCYKSGNTVVGETKNLKLLIDRLGIENVEFVEKAKNGE